MARQRMVTRTVKGNEIIATVVSKESKSIETTKITIGEVKTDKELNKVVAKALGNNKVLVSIDKVTPIEKRYGMLETDFIANAKELTKEEAESAEREGNE